MKRLKERAIEMGCWFKDETRKTSYPETWVPYFNVSTCKGKGNPNECSATKIHRKQSKTQIWKTVCYTCNREWTI